MLSIIAVCISVSAFVLSLIRHRKDDDSSKYIQYRNVLLLTKDVLKSAIELREKIRSIEDEILDEAFDVIKNLTENLVTVSHDICNIESSCVPVELLHELEIKVHTIALEVVSWESLVEDVSGFGYLGSENRQTSNKTAHTNPLPPCSRDL